MEPSTPRARRSTSIALAILVALGVTVSSTACDPVSRDWAWKAGKTHGAIIETTAGRASLEIYRKPSDGLYWVMKAVGIRKAQDYLWSAGEPPELKVRFTYDDHRYTVEFGTATKALRLLTHKLIYDDPDDLAEALRSTHREKNCLALTLISYGRPTSNWTRKNAGCIDGALP